MKRYRIRVMKHYFAEPHYITRIRPSLHFTTLDLNKNPLSWQNYPFAARNLALVNQKIKAAELEEYEVPDG